MLLLFRIDYIWKRFFLKTSMGMVCDNTTVKLFVKKHKTSESVRINHHFFLLISFLNVCLHFLLFAYASYKYILYSWYSSNELIEHDIQVLKSTFPLSMRTFNVQRCHYKARCEEKLPLKMIWLSPTRHLRHCDVSWRWCDVIRFNRIHDQGRGNRQNAYMEALWYKFH